MTPARTLFYHFGEPLPLDFGVALPAFTLAYQTWGKLDPTVAHRKKEGYL